MILRTFAILATVGALSCHRPAAQAEGPDPTTGAPESASYTSDAEPLELVTGPSARVGATTRQRTTHSLGQPDADTREPPTIALCCDEFAGGLCFRAEPEQCQAATSHPRECPAASVREIHDRDGRSAWLCAEP